MNFVATNTKLRTLAKFHRITTATKAKNRYDLWHHRIKIEFQKFPLLFY